MPKELPGAETTPLAGLLNAGQFRTEKECEYCITIKVFSPALAYYPHHAAGSKAKYPHDAASKPRIRRKHKAI